jgi:hypothetical protein
MVNGRFQIPPHNRTLKVVEDDELVFGPPLKPGTPEEKEM